MEKFRTSSGQTGMDAYVFEAAAIANAQRELNQRFTELLTVVHREAPELFQHDTDWHPALTNLGRDSKPAQFLEYLKGPEHYREWLRSHG